MVVQRVVLTFVRAVAWKGKWRIRLVSGGRVYGLLGAVGIISSLLNMPTGLALLAALGSDKFLPALNV